jgi:MrcB-like, N-terminal domain
MSASGPSVADVETSSSFSAVVARVLDLQLSWSSRNTPEMQERGVLIRQAGPPAVTAMLAGLSSLVPDLAVEGRDGTGLKTRVPWIRVYSKSRSPSATSGWYVAFLFAADGSAVFLSLNQGTTSFESGDFRARSVDVLETRVKWARRLLGIAIQEAGATVGEISLSDPRGLGAGYERGNVCSYRFARGELSDEQFGDRLQSMVGLLQELYAAEDDPARRIKVPEEPINVGSAQPSPPPLSDPAAFIKAVRGTYGPTLVESRRAAEEEARQLLHQLAGGMTKEHAQMLGQLFNRGEWAGALRHNRFLPAFAGATMERLVEPIEAFNQWTQRLWRSSEEEALRAVDEVLRNPNAFPGAGRSYPTMLMYLRDPQRFAVWLQVCHQGLIAISDYDEPKGRTGGLVQLRVSCLHLSWP